MVISTAIPESRTRVVHCSMIPSFLFWKAHSSADFGKILDYPHEPAFTGIIDRIYTVYVKDLSSVDNT